LTSVSTAGRENRLRLVPMSDGRVARFEDDHGRLCRPPDRIRVEVRIDGDPPLPDPALIG
jgi:hypothetical protein